MRKTKLSLMLGLLLSGSAMTAQASLSSTDGGLGVYDSVDNITWTSDANLLGTLEAANSGLIATIVSDEASTINSAYSHTLSAGDFGSGGMVDWWAAHAYVDYLNTIDYGNSNQWALPTTVDSGSSNGTSPAASSSQLAELFYTELAGTAGSSIPTNSLFTNEQSYAYWSGTEVASAPANAWFLYTAYGAQYYGSQDLQMYAWAVSPGQVSAVPVPGAVWLFGSGILGLLGLKRRG